MIKPIKPKATTQTLKQAMLDCILAATKAPGLVNECADLFEGKKIALL